MSAVEMPVADSAALGRVLEPRHVHAWELRAVEFDTWGQVRLYECLGCPGVRYV